ncbi:hypothetical protein ACFFGR_17225 [Arthrobacter liuii]|uniref:hypothetical protein n=1 Tax=Arthrobacter liuii TaxID=1476996 RepID=UPI0016672A8F|nr:hypothetical protein [Arthrobacter liuii]
MADPALGPVRTMRQHLIVAAAVNAVCTGLPGAPKVSALKDAWMMTGAAGASRQCHTLEELWSAVLGCFTDASVVDKLRRRRLAYAADPANEGLPARAAGLLPDPAAAEYFQGDSE